MSKYLLILSTFLFLACSDSTEIDNTEIPELLTEVEEYQDDTYEVGQVWNYNSREGEENSALTVVHIDVDTVLGVIIHVYADGLNVTNPARPNGISETIQHLPLSKEAMDSSVTALKETVENLPDYLEGYNEWKSAFDNREAGIWSLPMNEIVGAIESIFEKPENITLKE
ncbi:MAG: hypothetical protein ACI857_000605 [Arenicella sp.]|jgi:hypothetical protein